MNNNMKPFAPVDLTASTSTKKAQEEIILKILKNSTYSLSTSQVINQTEFENFPLVASHIPWRQNTEVRNALKRLENKKQVISTLINSLRYYSTPTEPQERILDIMKPICEDGQKNGFENRNRRWKEEILHALSDSQYSLTVKQIIYFVPQKIIDKHSHLYLPSSQKGKEYAVTRLLLELESEGKVISAVKDNKRYYCCGQQEE